MGDCFFVWRTRIFNSTLKQRCTSTTVNICIHARAIKGNTYVYYCILETPRMCSKEIICEEKENTYIISNTQTKPVSKSILILSMGTFFSRPLVTYCWLFAVTRSTFMSKDVEQFNTLTRYTYIGESIFEVTNDKHGLISFSVLLVLPF